MEMRMPSDSAVATASRTMSRERIGTCDVRTIQSPTAMELYVTATPGAGDIRHQAQGMYDRLAAALRRARTSSCRNGCSAPSMRWRPR